MGGSSSTCSIVNCPISRATAALTLIDDMPIAPSVGMGAYAQCLLATSGEIILPWYVENLAVPDHYRLAITRTTSQQARICATMIPQIQAEYNADP